MKVANRLKALAIARSLCQEGTCLYASLRATVTPRSAAVPEWTSPCDSVNPLGAKLVLFLALGLAAAQPASAQSILRDSETEKLFADMSKPLIEAAQLDPKNVKIVLINDPEINAFVAGGQVVYIHTGLLTQADNANQVQGVIAHELGHVAGGHVIRSGEGAKQATGISILSLVLGGLAMAAGAGEAGMGAMALGQQMAMGQFLAFTRAQETSADLAGVSYLTKAGHFRPRLDPVLQETAEPGISPRGLRHRQLQPHPPAQQRARRDTDRSLQEGPGLGPARPTRHSKRGSSGCGRS